MFLPRGVGGGGKFGVWKKEPCAEALVSCEALKCKGVPKPTQGGANPKALDSQPNNSGARVHFQTSLTSNLMTTYSHRKQKQKNCTQIKRPSRKGGSQ